MKKPKKIVLLIAVLGVICAIGFLRINSSNSYTRVVKSNWDIDLPKAGAKEIFAYSEPSFHGDGIRYHVIDYPIGNESKEIQNTVFQLGKTFLHSQKPSVDQVETVERLLVQIGAKEDMFPAWERCDLVYLKQEDGSELYLFYCYETGTVYAVESFL